MARLAVLLDQVKVVCSAQLNQHLCEGNVSGLISKNCLSAMSAEADVVVKLVSPGDLFEGLELHGREHTRVKQGRQ